MFRIALNSRPRACLAVGTAGCMQFVSYRKNLDAGVSCEPFLGLDSMTSFFKRGSSGTSKAPQSLAPLLVVGPSGVGKGTLIALLQKEYPDQFGFCVSTTTRDPRPGEVDGKDYHFADKATMDTDIKEGKYLEHAAVHSNFYGTSVAALEHVQSQHKIALLDIDVQGAKSVKAIIPSKVPEARFFFLAPPSMQVLEGRLRGRGTEKEEKIQVRLKNAITEVEFSKTEGFFDLVLVADDGFKEALPGFKAWLEEVYPQLKLARRK